MTDWIDLSPDALDTAAAIRFAQVPQAGGIDVFLGTTRAEHRADGVSLAALDYEAYVELARKQLQDLVAAARNRWPIERCVLLHRVGRVPLAEPSVVIVVATPHRAESFEACRWLIDSLKSVAAIWKQEVWTDGKTRWVDGAIAAQSPPQSTTGA
ncbi:MAG: molybdenum cofactor biosynthesis protein MoaE [Tepidisphaeraceae bacterium]